MLLLPAAIAQRVTTRPAWALALSAGLAVALTWFGIGIGFYGSCWSGVTGPRQSVGSGKIIASDNVMSLAHINAAYFATAAEYAHGGYEADYSCRGHGNPSQVVPESEQILVETG